MLKHLSQLILIVVAALIVVILIAFPVFPATHAQDGTPIITLEPTGTQGPEISGLPFSDPFDTDQGWIAEGAWTFDISTSYASGGWHVDGTQRETVSTLTYHTLLDLSGTLTQQIVYRQMGHLPQTDLITVEVSINNGQDWLAVDQQIGIDSEWDLHVVDLTPFRGQIVLLRFRVNTGIALPDYVPPEEGYGYWLDNVSIQYVMLPPEIAYIVPDTGPHTLMGLHLIIGARLDSVVDFAKRLRDVGRPLSTVKGTTGTEDILHAVAAVSPETTIIYRALDTPWGRQDCPNTGNDPVFEAQQWVTAMRQYWMAVPEADYYELMNECMPPVDWLIKFSIEAMRLANEQSQCLLLFSFSTGQPEPIEFVQLQPVFEYILANPCQPGRYHGIALHAYGHDKGTLVSESGLAFGLRHRMLFTGLLSVMPAAIQVPVYLTEVGEGDGRTPFRCEDIARDVIQYTNQLEYDPYVRGFNLWNFGPGGEWVDVTSCLPRIGDALIAYYSGQ